MIEESASRVTNNEDLVEPISAAWPTNKSMVARRVVHKKKRSPVPVIKQRGQEYTVKLDDPKPYKPNQGLESYIISPKAKVTQYPAQK